MEFQSDENDYRLLTFPESTLKLALSAPLDGLPVIHLFGNRQGILSLANVLLWLHANSARREFPSITSLPFVQSDGTTSLSIRVLMEDGTSDCGTVHLLDKGQQYEWRLSEELKAVALLVHRLGSIPEFGYCRMPFTQRGDAWIWFELFSNRVE